MPGYCTDRNLVNSTQCTDADGAWHTKAWTKSECLAHGNRCQDTTFGSSWNDFASSDCGNCGGAMQPVYRWDGGVWSNGTMSDLKWADRAYGSENSWALFPDYTKIWDVVMVGVAGMISGQYKKIVETR